MSRLYVGLVAPKTYVVDIVQGDSSLDLSTITAATIRVQKPDGSTTSWATVISGQTATAITLTFTFGATSELDMAGTWKFYAKFTIPGGFDRTEEWVEDVLPEHG